MKNINILKKITQGMYVLTTDGGGCIIDAVSQVSAGDNPLITVSVMRKNYTNELLKKSDKFALSIIGTNIDPKIIKTFGFNSMRDINKFESVETTDIEGIKIINESLGYVVCEIIDSIDNDTHTLFIGKLIEADVLDDNEAMSYQYYQEHKDTLMKVTTNNGQIAWVCSVCGYVYYGEKVPENFKCPLCGVGEELFERR